MSSMQRGAGGAPVGEDRCDAVPPLSQFLARRFASPSPLWSWLIFERLGGLLAYFFALAGVAPSAVTLAGGACGVAGAVVLGHADDRGGALLGGGLLLFAYTLDCADGQLARAMRRASPAGAWLDVTVDSVVTSFLTVAVASALLSSDTDTFLPLLLAGAFGASRIASLFTSHRVRQDNGGLRLSGRAATLRTAYIALMDTPFVYAALAVSWLTPRALVPVLVVVAVLTVGQVVVSARRHFRSTTATEFD